jgi:PilZ domain
MLKSGIIAYSGRQVTLKCGIRDFSDTGARLIVEGTVPAPDTFELMSEIDGLEVACQVVWRRSKEVGVKFTGPMMILEDRKRPQVVSQSTTVRPSIRRLQKLPA